MIDAETVQELLGHYAGWDSFDIERIVAPLAEDMTFRSAFVIEFTGGKSDAVSGKAAVRDYMAGALQRIPGIRYSVDHTYIGTSSLVVIWTAHFADGVGRQGADTMQIDAQGKVKDLRAHYTWEPSDVLDPA